MHDLSISSVSHVHPYEGLFHAHCRLLHVFYRLYGSCGDVDLLLLPMHTYTPTQTHPSTHTHTNTHIHTHTHTHTQDLHLLGATAIEDKLQQVGLTPRTLLE